MGCALAEAARAGGHAVTMVLGPIAVDPPPGVAVFPVVSAREMQAAANREFAAADIAIAAAAVCDWRPADRKAGKPPRTADRVQLELVPNPDIVAGLAAVKERRVVVGFALQDSARGLQAAVAAGRDKLVAKQLDLIAVNLHDAIDGERSEIVLCHADGRDERLPRQAKAASAERIIAAAVAIHERKGAA